MIAPIVVEIILNEKEETIRLSIKLNNLFSAFMFI